MDEAGDRGRARQTLERAVRKRRRKNRHTGQPSQPSTTQVTQRTSEDAQMPEPREDARKARAKRKRKAAEHTDVPERVAKRKTKRIRIAPIKALKRPPTTAEKARRQRDNLGHQIPDDDAELKLYRTPANVARLVGRILPPQARTVLDLCAGEGDLSQFIPTDKELVAVERDEARVARGKQLLPRARWLCTDFRAPDFQSNLGQTRFDAIVMNPPFSLGMKALATASEMIKGGSHRRVYAVLPCAYFLRVRRSREFRTLGLTITKEYKLGFVRYDDHKPTPKMVSDCLYVFRRSKRPTFSHRVYDVRLSGELDEPPPDRPGQH